ncbi:MAG: hypothetical protein V4534_07440 [Myxococcota bacterium]
MVWKYLGFYLLFCGSSIAINVPDRCDTLNDSLDAAQAEGRRLWFWRCFPTRRNQMQALDWLEKSEKGSPLLYPYFGMVDSMGRVHNPLNWFAPTNKDADCTVPDNYNSLFFCAAGCYTPEQKLWFVDGHIGIMDAYVSNISKIMVLESGSSIDNLTYKIGEIAYFITDAVPGIQKILNFSMLSGGKLKVTGNHPLIDGKGYMRAANTFSTNDQLILASGALDPVVSIEETSYEGKVYNVETVSEHLVEKVVVGEGYLNGSVYYQNEGVKYLNRLLLRSAAIPKALVQ